MNLKWKKTVNCSEQFSFVYVSVIEYKRKLFQTHKTKETCKFQNDESLFYFLYRWDNYILFVGYTYFMVLALISLQAFKNHSEGFQIFRKMMQCTQRMSITKIRKYFFDFWLYNCSIIRGWENVCLYEIYSYKEECTFQWLYTHIASINMQERKKNI